MGDFRRSIIRTEGDWESWVSFFLEGVATAASDAVKLLEDLGMVTEMTGQKRTGATATRPTSSCCLGDL